jgi:type IV pilus assembly protein PilE
MKGSAGPDRQTAPGAVAAIWRASRGFTLLEMLAVVTILGILMMSAQAAWWQHVARVRRSDATVALLGLAAAQEAYYLDALSYSGDLGAAPPDGLGFEGTEKGWYRVTVETDGPDRYRFMASPGPGSPQVLDEDCREFWIDQTGARGSSPEPASVCWR